MYKYVGTVLTSTKYTDEELRFRQASGSRTLYVLPVVRYGCEAWALNKGRKRRLEIF